MKTKNQSTRLDDLDWKILKALQNDARQTYSEIGHRIGLAHSTIYDRIKRMEEQGVIKKYTTIVDLQRIGIKKITAIVTVFTDPKEIENVAKKMSEFTQVTEVFTSLSEELLVIAKVITEDPDSLHCFVAQSVAPLPGVLRIRTSIITKKHKEENLSIETGARAC